MKVTMSVLKPLVRILIRRGVAIGMFVEWLKWVYVEVAKEEKEIKNLKQPNTRIAVLTGLTRKEVKRIQENSEIENISLAEKKNRSLRVLAGWQNDKLFCDDKNKAKDLNYDEGESSFTVLVNKYSGDMKVAAFYQELLRTGSIEKLKNGKVRFLNSGYTPIDEVEKLKIIGEDVPQLIKTIEYNIENNYQNSLYQKKVSYDNIPEEVIPEIKRFINKNSHELILKVNDFLKQYDRDANDTVKGSGRKKLGLGVFYFEENAGEN